MNDFAALDAAFDAVGKFDLPPLPLARPVGGNVLFIPPGSLPSRSKYFGFMGRAE